MDRKREELKQGVSFSRALARFRERHADCLGEIADAFANVRDFSLGRETDFEELSEDIVRRGDYDPRGS